jgi:hypothetical protein
MKRRPHPVLLSFFALLLLVTLACSFGSGTNTPAPVTTEVAAAAPPPTALVAAADENPDEGGRQHGGDPSGDASSGDALTESAVTLAISRATTMMAQNAKPTPPAGAGLGSKESEGSLTAATATPEPTAVPQRGQVGLQLDNRASTAGCFVYISRPNDVDWGADQLGATEVIASGRNRFFELSAGAYDLRVDDCSGKIIYADFEVAVAGVVSIQLVDKALPTGGSAPLTVLNDLAGVTVCYLFVSPAVDDTWGGDWLGTGQTVPEAGRAVLKVAENVYDLKAADCSLEPVAELYSVTIGRQGYVWALSGAATVATLDLVNNSAGSVCYVQISPATADTWGLDWLDEDEIIRPGAQRTFELTPDTYDLRALDCDQDTLKEEYGIDAQGTIRWVVP